MNEIVNGRLYFNEKRDRVERARGAVNTKSLLMSYHSDEALFAKAVDLRLADSDEVEEYKDSSRPRAVRVEIDHALPPLPALN